MIAYSYLTKRQLIDGNYSRVVDDKDPYAGSQPHVIRDHSEDQIIGVIAEDQNRLVGRLFLSYTEILVGDQLIRCAVGNNLYVKEKYRQKAVGIKLLWKAMELGFPYVAASTSADATPVFAVSKKFHLIDNSPIFSCGLNLGGYVRTARLLLQQHSEQQPDISMFRQFQVVASKVLAGGRLQRDNLRAITKLKVSEAQDLLPSLAGFRDHQVYLPWNKEVLINALSHKNDNVRAWIVTHTKNNVARNYLLTIYLVSREWSAFRTSDIKKMKIARVTEIFPSTSDTGVAQDLITFAAQQAREMDATILEVSANIDSLRKACSNLKFENFNQKKIWIAPGRAKGELIEKLCSPAAWWCRARNEDQFEETYQPIDTPRPLADNSVLI